LSRGPSIRGGVGVVGLGACTPVGLTAAATAAAVRAGVSRLAEHPFLLGSDGEPMVVAQVPVLGDLDGPDRFVGMATRALGEAVAPLRAARIPLEGIPVKVALPPARPGRPDDLEEALRLALTRELGVRADIRFLPFGHAAGLMAIEQGCEAILQGGVELCLVGGIDSYLDADTLEWLDGNGQVHGGDNAYGFPPGEAAGFCVLAHPRIVVSLRLALMARVWSVGAAIERNRIKTDTICLGQGLMAALRLALDALPSGAKVSRTYCDLNGEPYRSEELGFALTQLAPFFHDPDDCVTPVDCWGDVGAASGPLFASLFAASLARGYAAGPFALLWASSESGQRAATVLSAAKWEPG
jgi:3-oxoacyl-[acyl-carrier-protein] synthase-1